MEVELNEKILKIAFSQYGITEIDGPENNPEIMKYYHETGQEWVSSEETPWCDAAADWCIMKAGGQFEPGLLARGALKKGKEVTVPKLGDQVTIWRVRLDSEYGHTGWWINEVGEFVYILAGNTSNKFQIGAYRKNRILGYRRIVVDQPGEAQEKVKATSQGETQVKAQANDPKEYPPEPGSRIVRRGPHYSF